MKKDDGGCLWFQEQKRNKKNMDVNILLLFFFIDVVANWYGKIVKSRGIVGEDKWGR